jgi:hypothetical protein
VLTDFYSELAFKAEDLRDRMDSLTTEQLQQLAGIEDMLEEGQHTSLVGLTSEESADVWSTANVTRDPLINKWEREIAAGMTPDLDEEEAVSG